MSSRQEVDSVIVRRRLSLAGQLVTAASPEYDNATGVITAKAINLFILAPLEVKGIVWETDHPIDPYELPEDGDWVTVAAFARTSTVMITADNGSTIGFQVDGGASLTRVSTNATADTDDLRDQFNADPGYSTAGTASTVAPGVLSIAWSAAWPVPRAFTDLSTGAAVASGSVDVVQMINQSGDPTDDNSKLQCSHGANVYVDPFARPIQVIWRDKTPEGVDLKRWLVPDWSS